MWSGRRIGAVVAIGLAVVLAAGMGFLGQRWLDAPPADDSAEAGFARDMSVHHAQAVEMSMHVYRNGADEGIRVLAYDIALTQQAQIGIMTTWLSDWGLSPTSTEPAMEWMEMEEHGSLPPGDGVMPGMASQEEMAELLSQDGAEADQTYVYLMLIHHLAGIHMADGIVDLSDDDTVLALAESMRQGQRSEVKLLTEYQQKFDD